MPNAPDNLEYYVASKGGLVIVTLVGPFKNCTDVVERCIQEVIQTGCEFCIVYARDMSEMGPNSYKDMIHFQDSLRKFFKGNMRICSLHPAIRTVLVANGVVRQAELTNNLKETVYAALKKG